MIYVKRKHTDKMAEDETFEALVSFLGKKKKSACAKDQSGTENDGNAVLRPARTVCATKPVAMSIEDAIDYYNPAGHPAGTPNIEYGIIVNLAHIVKLFGKTWLKKHFNIIAIPPPGEKKAYVYEKVMKAYFKIGKGENLDLVFPRIHWSFFSERGLTGRMPVPNITRTLNVRGSTAISSLFDYQLATLEMLFEGVLNDTKPEPNIAYLKMDTGTGKTRIGAAIIERCAVPTVIIAPTDAIRMQWIKEVSELLPTLKILKYTKAKDGVHDVTGKYDIVVGVINTMSKMPLSFMKTFGLTIIDEAHEYCTDLFSRILWISQTKYVVGLSATPSSRPDGLDRIVIKHLGNPISGITAGCVDFQCIVRAIKYRGNPEYAITEMTKTGTVSNILTIANVIRDPQRLLLVAKCAKWVLNMPEHKIRRSDMPLSKFDGCRKQNKHGLYIFAEHRDYLPLIREALINGIPGVEVSIPEMDPDYKDIINFIDPEDDLDNDPDSDLPDINTGVAMEGREVTVLRGGVDESVILNTQYVACVTYGFGRRGLSLPQMTSMLFATPRKTGLEQIVGRILRRNSDPSIMRVVIDIVDDSVSLFSQYKFRSAFYRLRKYDIYEQKITWKEVEGQWPPPTKKQFRQ